MSTPQAARAELRGSRENRISSRGFEMREVTGANGEPNLKFSGFASVTGAPYTMEDALGEFEETVMPGAFKKTLSDGADVAFLLNHTGMTLARTRSGTLTLREVADPGQSPIQGVTGLWAEALLDPSNVYVSALRSAVDRGDLSEMSFAFRVTRERWSDSFDQRWIQEVAMDRGGDVSLVNVAANPATADTVSLRQRFPGRGAARPGARALSRGSASIILPDHTSEAWLDCARARAGLPLDSRLPDHTSEARRQLRRLRGY